MNKYTGSGYVAYGIENMTFVSDFKTGEVLESSTHSETHVRGSGGGGSVSTDSFGRVSGSTSNIVITSHVYTKTKIWVKLPNGKEEEWVVPGEASARVGHKVVLFSMYLAEKDKGGKIVFCNLTTGQMMEISSAEEFLGLFGIIKDASMAKYWVSGIMIGIVTSIFLGIAIGGVSALIGFVGPILGLGWMGDKRTSIIKSYNDSFILEIKNAIKESLDLLGTTGSLPTYWAYYQEEAANKKSKTTEQETSSSVIFKKEGFCVSCGGELKAAMEKAVGYCNECKNR